MKFEQDRSVQADTLSLPVPDSGVFLSTNISASPGTPDHLPDLERDDPPVTGLEDKTETELTNEMDQIIEDCKNHLQDIERNIESSNDKRFLVRLVSFLVAKSALEIAGYGPCALTESVSQSVTPFNDIILMSVYWHSNVEKNNLSQLGTFWPWFYENSGRSVCTDSANLLCNRV